MFRRTVLKHRQPEFERANLDRRRRDDGLAPDRFVGLADGADKFPAIGGGVEVGDGERRGSKEKDAHLIPVFLEVFNDFESADFLFESQPVEK